MRIPPLPGAPDAAGTTIPSNEAVLPPLETEIKDLGGWWVGGVA